MALSYTHTNYQDVHTLTNTGVVNLTYHLSTVTCDTITEIKTGVILPTKSVVLTFVKDGTYSVYLESSTETGAPIIIKSFNNLLNSFIAMIEGLVCGCHKCDDCEECNQCEDYLGAFMKAQAFYMINSPLYNAYYQSILGLNTCLITDEVVCSLLHEKVYGNVVTKDVMIYLLSCYYLAFYYKDHFLANDAAEQDYITTKYKFTKIVACMKKHGIDTTEPLRT